VLQNNFNNQRSKSNNVPDLPVRSREQLDVLNTWCDDIANKKLLVRTFISRLKYILLDVLDGLCLWCYFVMFTD
jgi:hypothetical protein